MYPLKFEPFLRPMIWGGEKIAAYKGVETSVRSIGESWELSGVAGHESIVAEGPCKGVSLPELIDRYGAELVGKSNYERFGNEFPLLVKFIDAREDLSIQVHPDDRLAWERHRMHGKTEMWYVVSETGGASLRIGFDRRVDAETYAAAVADHTICDLLRDHPIAAGDVFFLPAGRVHSIGAGAFIAEIQQTSNITYRIYDYDRKDANGNGRELHTELAKDAIDYTMLPDYRTHYKAHTNATVELADCKYFTTNLLDIDTIMVRDFSELDSFVVYICMGGKASIRDNKGNEIFVHQGQTVLIPADTQVVTISPSPDAKFMETYIGD